MKTSLLLLCLSLSACKEKENPVTPIPTMTTPVATQVVVPAPSGLANLEKQTSDLNKTIEDHLRGDEQTRSKQPRIEFLIVAQLIEGSGAFTNPAMAKAMGIRFGDSLTNWILSVPPTARTNGSVQELDVLMNHYYTNDWGSPIILK